MGYTPETDEGECFFVLALPELTIWGHTIDHYTRRDYPEDWSLTLSGREQGLEFACWHSDACSDGEIGSNAVDGLSAITREQFIEAWDKGWPALPPVLNAPVSSVYTWNEDGSIVKVWDSLHGDA
jgi:hypothetical protein